MDGALFYNTKTNAINQSGNDIATTGGNILANLVGTTNTLLNQQGQVQGTQDYNWQNAQAAQDARDRAETLAYLSDQESGLNRQMGRTNTTRDQGLTAIADNYNQSVSGANKNRSRFQEDWKLKQGDSERGRGQSIDRINTGARTLGESLRRRIGMASGGDSSAYKITAPGAVARDSTQKRTDVLGDYAVNFRNLDLSEKRNNEDYQGLLSDLASQRQSKERGLQSDILNQQNSISESLAEIARQRALAQGGGYDQVRAASAPIVSQIAAREGELDGLFNKYRTAYNVKPVRADVPELRNYLYDRDTALAQQEQGGSEDPTAFYRQPEDEEQLI
jgi:hypothetical protein